VGLARCKRTKSKQWKVTPRMHWQNGFCRCLAYDRRVDELVQQRCDYRYSLLHTFAPQERLKFLHTYSRGQSIKSKSFYHIDILFSDIRLNFMTSVAGFKTLYVTTTHVNLHIMILSVSIRICFV
jgi:hypothetical protein